MLGRREANCRNRLPVEMYHSTPTRLIKWPEEREREREIQEAQCYFGDKKKHLNKYLINHLLIITVNQVNSLLLYLEFGEMFGL